MYNSIVIDENNDAHAIFYNHNGSKSWFTSLIATLSLALPLVASLDYKQSLIL